MPIATAVVVLVEVVVIIVVVVVVVHTLGEIFAHNAICFLFFVFFFGTSNTNQTVGNGNLPRGSTAVTVAATAVEKKKKRSRSEHAKTKDGQPKEKYGTGTRGHCRRSHYNIIVFAGLYSIKNAFAPTAVVYIDYYGVNMLSVYFINILLLRMLCSQHR